MVRTSRLICKRLTGPATEPLTVADVKAFSRIYVDEDDALIGSLIVRAREWCETRTQRQFITATYALLMDGFPYQWRGDVYRPTERREGTDILLPQPPLVSVESITYLDQNGVQQTVDPATYIVSTFDDPGRIALAYGQTWPSTLLQINAVRVDYTAGFGDATAVPEGIKQAMHLLIGHWYENREATAPAASLPKEMDLSLTSILSGYACTEEWQGSLQ